MTDVLVKRGYLDTHTLTRTQGEPCEGERRDQGDASTSQGMPANASKPSQARERQGCRLASQPPEATNSADIWTWDFEPPELRENAFLLLKPPQLVELRYDGPSKLIGEVV